MPLKTADVVRTLADVGTVRGAARELGVDPATIRWHLRRSQERPSSFTPKPLPEKGLSGMALIDAKCRQFESLQRHEKAKKWREVAVNIDGPVCLACVGDPHVDDDGCNWPLLREHIGLLNEPGMLPINIGDSSNNWVGRLARLYAKQETTEEQAWDLVETFISSVPWLCVLLGNHDMWSGSGSPIKWMVDKKSTISEAWKADFELVFRKSRVRVSTAHDFKGNSMWNNTHGPLRAAMMGGEADIMLCGHTHSFGSQIIEHNGRLVHIARARGYKRYDEYAVVNGFNGGDYGATVCYLIDPDAPIESRFVFVPSLRKAAELLRMIRASKR